MEHVEMHGKGTFFDPRLDRGTVPSRTALVTSVLARLDRRERYIIEHRLMSEEQATLKEIGEYFAFSRERARQL